MTNSMLNADSMRRHLANNERWGYPYNETPVSEKDAARTPLESQRSRMLSRAQFGPGDGDEKL